MKCREVTSKLSDYLAGELTSPELAAISDHIGNCANCQAALAVERDTEAALRTLASPVVAPDLLGDLRRRLAASQNRNWRWACAGVAFAGAAAIILLLPNSFTSYVGNSLSPKATMRAGMSVAIQESQTHARREHSPIITSAGMQFAKANKRHARPTARHSTQLHRQLAKQIPPDSKQPEQPRKIPETLSQEPAALKEPQVGVILILGEPEPTPTSTSYYAEITLLDGEKSVVERTIERDDAGKPTSIRLMNKQIAASNESNGGNQG